MPIEFLTDEQAGKYGQFAGVPSRAQLERFFFLNDADRALIEQRRRDHNRLGFGVQLGTVRFLGMFLADPLDVPEEVLAYVAGQLKIDDLSTIDAYGEREKTAYEHAWEIRRAYGYREFVEAEAEQAHDDERGQERRRDGQQHDERDAEQVEKEQQDDGGEDHRGDELFLDTRDGGANGGARIGDHQELRVGGQLSA